MNKKFKSKFILDGILLNGISRLIRYLICSFEFLENFKNSILQLTNINKINLKKRIRTDYINTEIDSDKFLYEKIYQLSTRLNIKEKINIYLYCIRIDRVKNLKSILSLELFQKLILVISNRLVKSYSSDKNKIIFKNFNGEFYLIVLDRNGLFESDLFCKNIQSLFEKPFLLESKHISVTCSIGYSIHSNGNKLSIDLIHEAELALAEAQKLGYSSFSIYKKEISNNQKIEYILENNLNDALRNRHLSLHFQPVFHKDSMTVSHYEALSRWNHRFNGFISPEKFISIAEKTGQIHEIGRWLILETFSYLLHWEQTKIDLVPIAINLSPKQFEDHSIFIFLKKLLKSHEFIVNYLYLEITESLMLMNNEQNINILQELRELGLKVYLDDFGTGFSSLNYLIHFPIDGIKIDRIFVENLLLNNKNYNIIKNLISMAHALGLEVIAEGVETNEQMEILMDLDCQYFQGYFLSKPFPIEKVIVNN